VKNSIINSNSKGEQDMRSTQAEQMDNVFTAANLATRLRLLRMALVLFGLIFLVGLYPLMTSWWPAGWRWSPNQTEYEQMIAGVYATLGVFLIFASRNPLKHRSLIWFTVWSSLVHAGIMAMHAIKMPAEHGHLLGDIPALLLVAAVLATLMPRGMPAETSDRTSTRQ
jgi:hypothetical protein